jgi:hypothetical protein
LSQVVGGAGDPVRLSVPARAAMRPRIAASCHSVETGDRRGATSGERRPWRRSGCQSAAEDACESGQHVALDLVGGQDRLWSGHSAPTASSSARTATSATTGRPSRPHGECIEGLAVQAGRRGRAGSASRVTAAVWRCDDRRRRPVHVAAEDTAIGGAIGPSEARPRSLRGAGATPPGEGASRHGRSRAGVGRSGRRSSPARRLAAHGRARPAR